jgi:predicted carbohydrate-binding protein with CBM5 and CBM33 domain
MKMIFILLLKDTFQKLIIQKLSVPAFSLQTFNKMIFLLSSFLLASSLLSLTEGHGYLQSPRSRALYAFEEGKWWPLVAGNPNKENAPQSVQSKQSYEVCGTLEGRNYDTWNDVNGSPMPWRPQEVYTQGQEIIIESHLTANHWGHFEIYLCPNGRNSNQDCMFQNPATFVQDLSFGAPADSRFPQRAYAGSNRNGTYRHKFRLPAGVVGNEVLMQWRYVASNSCLPEGYVSITNSSSFK